MNQAQIQLLHNALIAVTEPTIAQAVANREDYLVVQWLNTTATPDFWCWRTSVALDEIMLNGFDWVQVDNLSVGKARIWEWLFNNETRSINPSKENIRAGIEECWKGSAPMIAVRDAVLGHCKRKITNGELIYATGAGTSVDPGQFGYEGSISSGDVASALNLPPAG